MIKRLDDGDIELLKQSRTVFGNAFEESHWHVDISNDVYLENILGDKNTIILVSLNKKKQVVGSLVAYVLHKIDKVGIEIYLYDLAVEEAYRKQGRATALIEELKVVGKEIGAYVIFVQADDADIPAISLYTKLCNSVEKDISHFDIEID